MALDKTLVITNRCINALKVLTNAEQKLALSFIAERVNNGVAQQALPLADAKEAAAAHA